MHEQVDEMAIAFRRVPQAEMMERLRDDFDKMMGILEPLGPDEWTGLMVTARLHGPGSGVLLRRRPADGLRRALLGHPAGHRSRARPAGRRRRPAGAVHVRDLAGHRPSATRSGSPVSIGIRVSGHNAGDYRVSVSEKGLAYEPGDIEDLPARIEFDAGSLVLTAFGRGNFGTVRGDFAEAERYLNMFFRI